VGHRGARCCTRGATDRNQHRLGYAPLPRNRLRGGHRPGRSARRGVDRAALACRPGTGQVATREEWIHANISSFRRLLGPVLARAGKGGQGLPGLLGPVGRMAAGAEMGVVLGWMSGRVLGQYDLLFADGDLPRDAVYYVGQNIVSLERRHGFEPREFGSGSHCTN